MGLNESNYVLETEHRSIVEFVVRDELEPVYECNNSVFEGSIPQLFGKGKH
jgi:hypothetical protein